MDNITISKKMQQRKKNKYSGYFSKILISIIFILSSLIFTNLSDTNYKLYKAKIIDKNIKYTKLKKLYEKYFGKVLPVDDSDVAMVFSAPLTYKKIENYNDGEKISFEENTIIDAIQSGIVVYIGEKEDYGNTVIIQGIDDVDIWYGNITNCNLKLYDYVEKNKIIGEVDKNLFMKILKNDINLKYEEYIKSL